MNESEILYHLAEHEGYAILRALLLEDLDNGDSPREALLRQLSKNPGDIAPWHILPSAVEGCRAGMRRAAIRFLIEHVDDFDAEEPMETAYVQ